MSRFIIALIVVFALIGCAKSPVAVEEAPFTPICHLSGFNYNQVIYDISDGMLYLTVLPQFNIPPAADSMWVNIQTYSGGVPVQSLVLAPKVSPLSWVVPANPADNMVATVCYKWQVTEWSETTFTKSLQIVAQP
jgi:hypothetical protein